MKVTYDFPTDTLTLVLKEDGTVVESAEAQPGLILDLDAEGNVVSLEILDASRRVTNPRVVEVQSTS